MGEGIDACLVVLKLLVKFPITQAEADPKLIIHGKLQGHIP